MKRAIDIEAILTPFPGENPAGEDLRYNPIYDEIKEARRADDVLDRGEWQTEVKTSEWDKVITISLEALSKKTKDLQIAVWLTEAVIMTEGFDGLSTSLKILTGLLRDYWELLYPQIEEGDLEYRIAPLEFMNNNLWYRIKNVSLTDKRVTTGYSWLKWQESREVGYETNTRNRYGDIDETKKKKRDEFLADGKLSAEDFDSAAALSSGAFYKSLVEILTECHEEFRKLDALVDERFGKEAPSLSDFGKAIEDCRNVVMKIYEEKKKLEPVLEPEPVKEEIPAPSLEEGKRELEEILPKLETTPPSLLKGEICDINFNEKALWEEALQILNTSGIKKALDRLLVACYSAPSMREKNRCRLLIAKLCLKAERPDLARPIVEEIHAFIEELHLERWESPLWIGEVLEALYQCLTNGEPSDDDISRARILFQKLCTIDVTKAITYRI